MRRLHRVSPKETFVASGIYEYFRDGHATGTVEYWEIHEQPGGAHFIRADRDGRESDGVSLLVQILRKPLAEGGNLERLDLYYYFPGGEAKGYYTFNDDYVVVRRITQNGEEHDEIRMQPGYLVNPLVLVEQRYWLRLAEHSVPHWVFSPDIVTTENSLSMCTSVLVGAENYILGAKSYPATRYQRRCESGDTVTALFDAHGVLLRYNPSESEYVLLKQYARRPER